MVQLLGLVYQRIFEFCLDGRYNVGMPYRKCLLWRANRPDVGTLVECQLGYGCWRIRAPVLEQTVDLAVPSIETLRSLNASLRPYGARPIVFPACT